MIVGNNRDHDELDANYYFKKLAEKGIMENIFSRIVSRRPLALVNKLFYKTVCNVDNSMDIFRARFESHQMIWEDEYPKENIYASVYCSKRALTEIYISEFCLVDIIEGLLEEKYHQCEYLFGQTLRKISERLQKLTLYSCIITESQLTSILDSVNRNNLREINIVEGIIVYEKIRKYDRKLKFPSLKKLDLSGTKYLNPNPNDQFCPNSEMFCFLSSIGKNSKLLEDLSIHETFVNLLNIANLKLKRLQVEQAKPANLRLATIISIHANSLTTVDFLSSYVMEDVLNEILQVPQLKSLKINLDGISLKGFINISATQNITELGLKCSNACKWVINSLSMHTLSFLKSFYLDIKDLDVNFVDLSRMLNKNIPKIHVIASQHYILSSFFSSTFISELQVCKIELHVDGSECKKLLIRECPILGELKEFTLINRNDKFYNYDCDLRVVLDRTLFVEKLRIEGFEVTANLFETAIKSHYYLEELYLVNPKGIQCNFIFGKNFSELISIYGRKLKIVEVSCAKSKLKRSKQFPFISRRGNLKIFRHR